MTPQPGTAGTDDDPLDSIETEQLVVNGQTIDTLVGLAFDSANATDGVLRFDGTGSTNGITDGSAKVIVGGTAYDVAGGEWVDFSGTSHTLDSWEKVVTSQFDVTITGEKRGGLNICREMSDRLDTQPGWRTGGDERHRRRRRPLGALCLAPGRGRVTRAPWRPRRWGRTPADASGRPDLCRVALVGDQSAHPGVAARA
jgi:hypothetical protein